ncbi:MAG TPA: energy transducer TonB [Candidatus Eisenbacteria bacterium]|nr:energy transducer TonB [Candidatus Eisenbacteria bacterium]
MSSAHVEPVKWSRRRWGVVMLVVLALHLGVIFWLREPPPVSAARSSPPFRLRFASVGETQEGNLSATFVSDPTLFALPGRRGFSGQAWLKFTPLAHRIENWVEPPTWLDLPVGKLGESFSRFITTNAPPSYHIADQPLPTATILDVVVPAAMVETQSVLRIEGSLARRGLLTPLALRSWPHRDLLPNSVVEVIVDAVGLPISARLLAESGRADVDQAALTLAKTARFRPLQVREENRPLVNAPEMTFGKLIFEWHTVPLAATNSPVEPP